MKDLEKTEMNCTRSSALPFFLTGLGTGFALSMLFAPQSGARTRSLIGRKVKHGEDWVKDTATGAEDYVRGQAAKLHTRADEALEAIGRI